MKKTNTKPKRAEGGFSFIEVLVSLALVSLLITMTAELIIFSLMAKRKADLTAALAGLAAGKLESLKAIPFEAEGLREGEYTETVQDAGGRKGRLDWRVENVSGKLKRISVGAYPENEPEKQLSLGVYVSEELGFAP